MIYDYLEKHKIGIGKPMDPEDGLSEEEIDYLEEYKKEIASMGQISSNISAACGGKGEKARQELTGTGSDVGRRTPYGLQGQVYRHLRVARPLPGGRLLKPRGDMRIR